MQIFKEEKREMQFPEVAPDEICGEDWLSIDSNKVPGHLDLPPTASSSRGVSEYLALVCLFSSRTFPTLMRFFSDLSVASASTSPPAPRKVYFWSSPNGNSEVILRCASRILQILFSVVPFRDLEKQKGKRFLLFRMYGFHKYIVF